MYLKYHKAGLTPTTPVTSIAISPVKMSIGRKSLTNLRSEMIFLQGKSVFSSPGPKVHVNYCHHLASVVCRLSFVVCRLSSVVCKLFTFQASSPKPLGRLEPNLAGMFLGWSSIKLLFFVPVGYSIWLPRPIICSDWPKFQRSSSLKLMN